MNTWNFFTYWGGGNKQFIVKVNLKYLNIIQYLYLVEQGHKNNLLVAVNGDERNGTSSGSP